MKVISYKLWESIPWGQFRNFYRLGLSICLPTRFCLMILLAGELSSDACFAQSVVSPNVKCVSVATNGNVTLWWAAPAGPGSFLDYKIFSSLTPAGPFVLVDSVTSYLTTSYTHMGAGANTKRVYYLIKTEYGLGAGTVLSTPLDTFSTIFLKINKPGFNNPNLTWNQIAKNSIPNFKYKILREHPAGVWSIVDSTLNTKYTDIFHLCNDTANYLIQLGDNSGCTSSSNVVRNKVSNTQPDPTFIDTVSVNAANFATISWYPSTSPNIDSVIIYKKSGGISTPIAIVKYPQTLYTYTASLASTTSEMFRVAFKDSCGYASTISTYHQTIYLSTSFNPCAGTANLVWNKYVNWTPGVNGYEIWKSVGGKPFSLIHTNNSDTTYTDTGLELGASYCYFIRARNSIGKTSSSNKVCFTPNVTNPPKFTYNRFVTVTGDKSIFLKAHVDPLATSVNHYRIQRATGAGGTFSVIATKVLPTGSTFTYTDNGVNTGTNDYTYKIDAMDSCDHVIMTSNSDNTMHLVATISPNLEINLAWNDYSKWLGGVDHYEIYRAVDGIWDTAPIVTIPFKGDSGAYTDDIKPFFTSGSRGLFSYYVKAIEGSGDTFSFTDSSVSNIVNVNEYPKFYVPNAFTPNGDNLNDVFIPVIGFIDPNAYSLTIFDNTGTPAFETRNPTEGWDGKKRGHPCQEGVYMYLIKCRASNGDDSKISGTLSLFR